MPLRLIQLKATYSTLRPPQLLHIGTSNNVLYLNTLAITLNSKVYAALNF